MEIKKYKKEIHTERAFCECGGELIYDTSTLFTKFSLEPVHICTKCKKEEVLNGVYPKDNVVYVEL